MKRNGSSSGIEKPIDRSSLGSSDARRARKSVPVETGRAVVARAAQLPTIGARNREG